MQVAIALETGVQNFALVLALVSLSFTGCARTETLGFILLGMFFYVVNSFWLCAAFRYWRNSREHSSAAAPDRQATAAAEEEAKGGGDTAVAAAKVGGVADANNP
jgi:predicted Na+-dependent transporter